MVNVTDVRSTIKLNATIMLFVTQFLFHFYYSAYRMNLVGTMISIGICSGNKREIKATFRPPQMNKEVDILHIDLIPFYDEDKVWEYTLCISYECSNWIVLSLKTVGLDHYCRPKRKFISILE
jgi:hypothetical protein